MFLSLFLFSLSLTTSLALNFAVAVSLAFAQTPFCKPSAIYQTIKTNIIIIPITVTKPVRHLLPVSRLCLISVSKYAITGLGVCYLSLVSRRVRDGSALLLSSRALNPISSLLLLRKKWTRKWSGTDTNW